MLNDDLLLVRAVLQKILLENTLNEYEEVLANKNQLLVDAFRSSIIELLAWEVSVGVRNSQTPELGIDQIDSIICTALKKIIHGSTNFDANTLISFSSLIQAPLTHLLFVVECATEYNDRQQFEVSKILLQRLLVICEQPNIEEHFKDNIRYMSAAQSMCAGSLDLMVKFLKDIYDRDYQHQAVEHFTSTFWELQYLNILPSQPFKTKEELGQYIKRNIYGD